MTMIYIYRNFWDLASIRGIRRRFKARTPIPANKDWWPTSAHCLRPCTPPQIHPQGCATTWGHRRGHRDRFYIDLPLKTRCKSRHFWDLDSEILPLPRISPGRRWSRDSITWLPGYKMSGWLPSFQRYQNFYHPTKTREDIWKKLRGGSLGPSRPPPSPVHDPAL